MKIKRILWFSLICALLLASCQPNSSGPSAWIDQPLDGSVFPLQPVILTAHASDNDGVASFEVYLNDELLKTLSAGGDPLPNPNISNPLSTFIIRVWRDWSADGGI